MPQLLRRRSRDIALPIGGLERTQAFQNQPPYTSPLLLNAWPLDPSTDRLRLGQRPTLYQIASMGYDSYGWCPSSYIDTGTTKEGIWVVTSNGVYGTTDGTTWTNLVIATNPDSTFASVAQYNDLVFMARSGGTTIQATVLGASEAVLSNAGGGTAPTNCGLVWVHQDRLMLGGNGHQIFAAAVGDSTNWDYDDPTDGAAWTNTGAEGGHIGHIVVAALNHNRDVSLVGSPHSIYAVVGNPKVNGTEIVSQTIGPLMNNAWCKGIDAQGGNATFLFSYDGLYEIPADGYKTLVKISHRKIPKELLGVNPAVGDKACIGYDTRWQGLHLSIDYNTGSDVNYFYHVPTDSWWPMSLPITPHVYALMPALQTSARSSVVVLGSAGSVRQYDNGQAQGGSNESFDSYVVIGPLKVGDINNEGVLLGLTAALAKDSANVSAKVYGGVTVEQAYQKVVADSPDYTLTNWSYASTRYWNYWQHPRLDCHAYYLKIADVSNTRWMLEGLVDETAMRGVMRRVR